jgi:leucyl-tRNA synthetase
MGREALKKYLVMLAPMAPHVCEEMWRALGHNKSIHLEPWPKFDPELIKEDTVTVVVQVNGKVRDRLQVSADASEEQVREMALASEAVKRHLGGKQPRKIIYVPAKMLSIVV